MNRIVIVGSVNIDITSYLERSPVAGETVFAKDVSLSLGGKGANQSVAASRLGMATALIGGIGSDPFAQMALSALQQSGVDCLLTEMAECSTGLALIDVMADGSNCIRISSGANAGLTAGLIHSFTDIIAAADILLLQNEIPLATSVAAAQIARKVGTRTLMDPAPAPDRPWPRETLSLFDILTPNAHEVAITTGQQPRTLADAALAARNLCDAGVPGAVVTMGDLGVAWCLNGRSGQRKATPVVAVDTVAAGDCFNAALAVALADGMDNDQAIGFACDVAALATTRKGASESAPRAEEVTEFRKASGAT